MKTENTEHGDESGTGYLGPVFIWFLMPFFDFAAVKKCLLMAWSVSLCIFPQLKSSSQILRI